jgi:hypothetical protein
VLAYQACDAQARSWVIVPTAVATILTIGAFGVVAVTQMRSHRADEPQSLLARIGVGVAALMVIVMLASLIAPLLLRPCD